ncbi:putative 50S ribosomal protein L13 [Magnetofaba australis IT-1]|uniref:Large ribosomal subunit protein uL13 n=1 Tax=Magnetofaba australis IT-1 TaxID=1434232 RepID=A0A1Y2K1C2_9PROT|nr:putative 50S ribosomal protein L13 [Magnetofaba australis IT-1]
MATPKTIERKWYVVDAEGKTLGRLATQIAMRLRGKHKAIYTPFIDTGDYIIVVNAEKVALTGNKLSDKVYYSHSRHPGGLKSITAGKQLSGKFPERVIEHAVRGMMPKGKMGREMFRKLKIYKGAEHPHNAQNPIELSL